MLHYNPNMFRPVPCSSSGGQIILLQPLVSSLSVNSRTVCQLKAAYCMAVYSGVPRGVVWDVQTPPPARNSEDIRRVFDRMSKKNRRLDFLL